MSSNIPVICGAMVLGSNNYSSLSSAEIYSPSDPAEIFRNKKYHGDALATLLNSVQDKVGFHPKASVTSEEFFRYVQGINDTRRYFLLINEGDQERTIEGDDYNKLIDSFENFFKNFFKSGADEIRASIVNMARSLGLVDNSSSDRNYFFQHILDFRNTGNHKFYLVQTLLHFEKSSSGKTTIIKQSCKINTVEYALIPSYVIQDADKLAELNIKSVDDWIKDVTSPSDPNLVLCFEKSVDD